MCKMSSQLKYGSGMPTTWVHIYIQTWKLHISGITHFPFSTAGVVLTPQTVYRAFAKWLEVFVGLGTFKDRKKKREGLKKKPTEAPRLPLWWLTVTAWSAISSSPTAAASCAAGRRPGRPPAPRTPAVGAGGPCSTWPRPGMTSAGRGR